MELTKEWQPYNGEYEKKMQDVKLKNGDIVFTAGQTQVNGAYSTKRITQNTTESQ